MSRSPFTNVFQSGRVAQQSNLPVKTQSPPSRSSPPEARWATRSFGVSVWHTGQRCLARAGLQLTASALGPLPEVRVSSPRGEETRTSGNGPSADAVSWRPARARHRWPVCHTDTPNDLVAQRASGGELREGGDCVLTGRFDC